LKTVNIPDQAHHALSMHCAKTQCLLKDVLARFIEEGIKRDNEKLNKAVNNAKNQTN